MKLSNKLEYACRVLAQLARSHGRGHMAHIDQLAEAEAIPANYLVQILNELRGAGLIVSKRGKQGGYALARSPEQIRLDEIVRAVDPELLERSRATEGQSANQVAAIWNRLSEDLEGSLKDLTLDAFVADDGVEMYYI